MEQIKIYCDGGSRGNPGPGASAFIVVQDSKIIFKASKFLRETTNNQAEYGGVVMALSWLKKNRNLIINNNLTIFLDSQLVTRQLKGIYKIKSNHLKILNAKIKNLEKQLLIFPNYVSIPRENNRLADALVSKEIDEKI